MATDRSQRIAQLRDEIEELKFQAFRRREWHDDPVGAIECKELAQEKSRELEALLSA